MIGWTATQQKMNQKLAQLLTNPSAVAEGSPLLAALSSAGATYNASGNDSILNTTLYGQSINTWWSSVPPPFGSVAGASFAWTELDRMARYCYSVASQSDQAAAASAFGVTSGGTPVALPPDVTMQTQSTLTGRVSAAQAMTSVASNVQSILSTALSAWNTALANRPAANPSLDAASTSAINALNTAIDNCNAWLASLGFH